MLQSINARLKGWVAWVIVILIALSFAMWGMEALFEYRADTNKTIAKVNGESIKERDLQHAFENGRDELVEQFDLIEPLTPETTQQLRQALLQRLITAMLLEQNAERNALTINQKQAEADLRQIPFFQVDGKFSAERFRQLLQINGYSYDDFMKELERGMLVNQLRAGIIGSAFTLPGDVDNALGLLNQTRDFRYAVISAAQLRKDLEPSDEEALAYYSTNQVIFYSPEEIKIEYVELSLLNLAKSLAISADEIKAYYEEQFATEEDTHQPEFAEVASDLEQQLRYEQAREQFSSVMDDLANIAFVNPDSLESIEQELQLPVQTTDWFTRQGGENTLLANPTVVHTAFSTEVLEGGMNSDLVAIDDETYIVLRVAEHKPSALLPFEEVQPLIKSQLIFQAAKRAAEAYGDSLVAMLASGNTSLPADTELNWHVRHNISRDDDSLNVMVRHYAFRLPAPEPGQPLPSLGTSLANGDYLIVQLQALEPGNTANANKSAKGTIRDQMEHRRGILAYELYVQGLQKSANIDVLSKPLSSESVSDARE